MQEDGTSKLGLAIYRCTYGNDDAWNRYMDTLQREARSGLLNDSALDLESKLDWVVFNDEALEGASIDEVRSSFQQWATEQVRLDGVRERCYAARYNLCIYVDKDGLEAVLGAPELPHNNEEIAMSYVTILDARRYFYSGWEPSHT